MEEGAPHDGNAHSGAYARGRSRGLRLPKCRDSGRPPFPQAHGVFSSLRGGSSRSRRSRSVQSLLLPRPDGFSLGRSRRRAASPLRIFLKAQGFKPFPQAHGVSLRRNAPVLPEQAVPADVPRLPVTASVSSGLLCCMTQGGYSSEVRPVAILLPESFGLRLAPSATSPLRRSSLLQPSIACSVWGIVGGRSSPAAPSAVRGCVPEEKGP